MSKSCPLLVFSDLDGTLLDHDTYEWSPAIPALSALRDMGAGVVLASSKTAAEIAILQDQIGLHDWPAIVENGAGLLGDGSVPNDYRMIRDALQAMPNRAGFCGFGDMTAEEVSAATGLPLADATRAKARQFSEPGLWSGTEDDKARFLEDLADKGIAAREGGRFLTLSRGKTKADQMATIIARFQPEHTLALGDAPNDIEMLQTADHGVIIANPHRSPLPKLPGDDTGTITRTKAPGPEGWNIAVLDHINALSLQRTDTAHG